MTVIMYSYLVIRYIDCTAIIIIIIICFHIIIIIRTLRKVSKMDVVYTIYIYIDRHDEPPDKSHFCARENTSWRPIVFQTSTIIIIIIIIVRRRRFDKYTQIWGVLNRIPSGGYPLTPHPVFLAF